MQNAMLNKLKNQFISKAKTLATVMTKNPNTKVTVSGNQAYRIPGLINLPLGDFTDPEWRQMLEGWIDHELGHESETDSFYFREAKHQSIATKDLLNAIEDVRMEKIMGDKFRGAQSNLANLARLAVKRELFIPLSELHTHGVNPIQLVQGLCNYRGRYLVIHQEALRELSEDAYQTCVAVFGQQLTDAICLETDKVAGAKSTEDAYEITIAIMELLKQENDKKQSDESDESDGEPDGEPTQSDIGNAVAKALSAQAGDGMKDFHELLADLLSDDAEDAQEAQPYIAGSGGFSVKQHRPYMGGVCDRDGAKRMSGRIYQIMHKVLFDQVQTLAITRDKGCRLKASKLSGVAAGNFNVFKQRVDQQDVSAVVEILVDSSESMDRDSRMCCANTSALAFAKGLEKAGIPVEVTYFGVWNGNENCVYTAKAFNASTVDKQFTVKESGGTPTGEAMIYTLNSLALRSETKKILILITDGNAADPSLVQDALQIARSLSVNVVPIGINTGVLNGFDKDSCVTVESAADLPMAIQQAVKLRLLK